MRIEDYAVLGDTQTAALVGRDGSIDWLCLPRFDSGACFAALLGEARHGRWIMSPAGQTSPPRRRYRPGTLILETEFETEGGGGAAHRLHAAARQAARRGPHRGGRARAVTSTHGARHPLRLRLHCALGAQPRRHA